MKAVIITVMMVLLSFARMERKYGVKMESVIEPMVLLLFFQTGQKSGVKMDSSIEPMVLLSFGIIE